MEVSRYELVYALMERNGPATLGSLLRVGESSVAHTMANGMGHLIEIQNTRTHVAYAREKLGIRVLQTACHADVNFQRTGTAASNPKILSPSGT